MRPDSLIFDMDGTLWNAVDTYAHCWNIAAKEMGIDKRFTGNDLIKYMGMEAKKIFNEVFPHLSDTDIDQLYANVVKTVDKELPTMGGKIYPDVIEGLNMLATKYRLFMLSNCQKNSIGDFLQFTNTKNLFVDYIEYGSNFQPKYVNMKTLIDKYELKNPMYIGDTDSDRKQSEQAGVPFVFVSFGFGKTEHYTLKFDSFKELTTYFMDL